MVRNRRAASPGARFVSRWPILGRIAGDRGLSRYVIEDTNKGSVDRSIIMPSLLFIFTGSQILGPSWLLNTPLMGRTVE
jgi:hypothetical protein